MLELFTEPPTAPTSPPTPTTKLVPCPECHGAGGEVCCTSDPFMDAWQPCEYCSGHGDVLVCLRCQLEVTDECLCTTWQVAA